MQPSKILQQEKERKLKNSDVKQKYRGRWNRHFKDDFQISLLALPGMVFLITFCYFPLYGIIIAFKDYNPNLGIIGSPWVGLANFKFFFASQDAVRVLRNTLLYSAGWLVMGMVCAIALAVLFYNLKSRIGLKVYNTVVILPKFMSTVLIAYVVYILLSPTHGIFNNLITAMGGEDIQWYSEAKYWPAILTVTRIWSTVGMDCIIYYAALVGIDEGLLEAASLDGAGSLQRVWHVMIPHLTPTIVTLLILGVGHLFSGDFGLFYQVTKDQGVLYSTTDIISTYTYRALMTGSMEKSAAIGLFQSLAGFLLVIVTNLIVRKVSPENNLF